MPMKNIKHLANWKKYLSWLLISSCFVVPELAIARSPRRNTRGAISHPTTVVPTNAYYSATFPSQGVSALPPTASFSQTNTNCWQPIQNSITNNNRSVETVSSKDTQINNKGKLSPEVLQTIRELQNKKVSNTKQMAPAPVYDNPEKGMITGVYKQGLIAPYGASTVASQNEDEKQNEVELGASYLKLPAGKNININSLDFRETPVSDALRSLASIININIMLDTNITGQVTVMFTDVTIEEAFNTLLSSFNLTYEWKGSILRILNKANAPIITKMFAIQHTNAADLQETIEGLLTQGKGTCKVDSRTNSIIINDTAEKIKEIKSLLPQLDIKESSVEISSRPMTEVFYLSYADAESLTEPIKMLSENVKIQDFSTTQASQAAAGGSSSGRKDMMIITDTQTNLDRIRELIDKLDVPPVQVTIDAHIYEIDKSKEEQLGVNWQKAIPIEGTNEDLFNISIAPTSADAGGTGVFRFGSINANQFTALLSMLNTSSFAKVLSNPVITTLNNRQAQISVGQAISYVSSSQTNAETGNVTTTVSQANADISLDVTPSVTGNDEVFLDIKPQITSVLGYTTLSGNATPNLSTRSASTQVICKNNHTIIIGGMIKTDINESVNKVPFFGSLPGIGKLFQSKTKNETRSELIIFITPRIIHTVKPEHQESDILTPRLTLAD